MNVLRRLWSIKPPVGVQINWGNELTRGLKSYLLLNEGIGNPRDLADTRRVFTRTGAVWSQLPAGRVVDFAAGTNRLQSDATYQPVPDWPLTMFILCQPDNATALGLPFYVGTTSLNYRAALYVRGDQGGDPIQFLCLTPSGNVFAASGNGYTAGKLNTLCGVARTQTDRSVWLNGVETIEGTPVGAFTGSTTVCVGANPEASGQGFDGKVLCAAVWNRALTGSEVKALTENPYMFLSPSVNRVFSVTSEGGGEPGSFQSAWSIGSNILIGAGRAA